MPLDDLFTRTYSPESLSLSQRLPKRTDPLQDAMLTNIARQSRDEAEFERIRNADSVGMVDPLPGMVSKVAEYTVGKAMGLPAWLAGMQTAVPSSNVQGYSLGVMPGKPGTVEAPEEFFSSRRELSQDERDTHIVGMMDEVDKLVKTLSRKYSNLAKSGDLDSDLQGQGFLGVVKAAQGQVPSAPDELKRYLKGAAENSMMDHIRERIGINTGEESLGLSHDVAAPEAAPQIPLTPSEELAGAIKTLPNRNLRSLANQYFREGWRLPQIQQANPGPRGPLDSNFTAGGLDQVKQELQHFPAVSPAQHFREFAAPEEISDAIGLAVKQAKSAKVKSMARPAMEYLLNDRAPASIARSLGYQPKQFPDFADRLRAITTDVRDILLKLKSEQ